MVAESSRDVDELFAARLAEFTRRRNALVAKLRKVAQREEAATVQWRKRASAPV